MKAETEKEERRKKLKKRLKLKINHYYHNRLQKLHHKLALCNYTLVLHFLYEDSRQKVHTDGIKRQ